MKFGKNIIRAIGLSNPEWFPFWVNYKLLKKIIKDLPTVVPPSDTTEAIDSHSIRKNPNEVLFFKQLHAEFQKVSSFFANAKKELKIRYDRVKVGKGIFNGPHSKNTPNIWMRIERSAYKLQKSLLLLEGFAIMNYCAFSKILKKHDKRTGYSTKVAFMTNIVNASNFAAYPDILAMIQGCEALINESSQHLKREEKSNLEEDEKLFLGLVQKINEEHDEDSKYDGVGGMKRCSPVHRTVITPVSKKSVISRTPSILEDVFMDLDRVRRLRTVSYSDYSTLSELSPPSPNTWKTCKNETFDCDTKKHSLPQLTMRRLKKPRHR